MGNLKNHIDKPVSIAPLAIFRVLFGFMMLVSVLRFIVNGWVYELYIAPKYFFTYWGFEWVKPLGEVGMYSLFGLMVVSAMGIMLGWRYKLSATLFFLSFTYVELIDKTNYLNHYYFVSIVSLVMIFLPANRFFSLDTNRNPNLLATEVPAWNINIIKLMLGMVYFYAGVAKLNQDWLIEAMPLKIWLPVNTHLPVIGSIMDEVWVAYFFSWFGAIYDITIPFFLLYSRTRGIAYVAVIIFHILTWLLFPIGMFPFIMILSTLIFFSPEFHKKLISKISAFLRYKPRFTEERFYQPAYNKLLLTGLGVFIIFQLAFPWRYLLYPGNLFWTEEGFRFSWRVMLIEKVGYVTFHIIDPETGRKGEVYPSDYLTSNQEKQMSTQPDMILQFAHFIVKEYKSRGVQDPQVKAEAYVTLNGIENQLFIDSNIDLSKEKEGFRSKKWILPFNENRNYR